MSKETCVQSAEPHIDLWAKRTHADSYQISFLGNGWQQEVTSEKGETEATKEHSNTQADKELFCWRTHCGAVPDAWIILGGLRKHRLVFSHVIPCRHYGLFYTCVTNLINLLYSTMWGSKFRNVTFTKFKLDAALFFFIATLPFQRFNDTHRQRLPRTQKKA